MKIFGFVLVLVFVFCLSISFRAKYCSSLFNPRLSLSLIVIMRETKRANDNKEKQSKNKQNKRNHDNHINK